MTLPRTYKRPVEGADLVVDAQALVDAVTMDDSGMMIGGQWVGGNGGLLSRDTLKATDKLRQTIAAIKSEEEEAGKK